MKNFMLMFFFASFAFTAIQANCVVYDEAREIWVYMPGMNCERDYLTNLPYKCRNVASPPTGGETPVDDAEIRIEDGKRILYLQINGIWEDFVEVTEAFNLPSDPSVILVYDEIEE